MRTDLTRNVISTLQINLYSKLNNFSETNKTLGRFCSIPLSIVDVGLDTLRAPLSAIENVAMTAINLIGAAFSKEYTLKHALGCAEFALGSALYTSVRILVAPLKIIYQLFAITFNPEKVQSISWQPGTFKD